MPDLNAFRTKFGQFLFDIKEDGIHLMSEAENAVDHMSWSEVKDLLVKGIHAVAPDVLTTPQPDPVVPPAPPADDETPVNENPTPAPDDPDDPDAPAPDAPDAPAPDAPTDPAAPPTTAS